MNNLFIPLTQSQLQLWAGQKLNPESPLHNTAHSFNISGNIKPEIFSEALNILVSKADALRILFSEQDGMPYQTITNDFDFNMEVIYFDEDTNETDINSWLKIRRERKLDLTKRVFDTVLLVVNSNRYIWFLNMHHLVTDAVSATLVYKYVAQLYHHIEADTLNDMEKIPAFKDYIDFEHKTQKLEHVENAKYWIDKVRDFNKTSNFYGKQPKGNLIESRRVSIKLGLTRYQNIKELALKTEIRGWNVGLTQFNILATAFIVFLHRISGDKNVVIGAPYQNRITKEFKKTIGLFIEIFPIALELSEDDTFFNVLERVKLEANDYLRHAKPGMVIPEVSRSFNTIFNFITANFSEFNGMPMTSEWMHTNNIDMTHQLRCHVYDFDATGNMEIHFDLNKSVFNDVLAEQVPAHFLTIIDAMLKDINQPIYKNSLIALGEAAQFLEPKLEVSNSQPSVLKSFENVVNQTPNAVALQYNNETLTFKGLNKKANQLAHYLMGKNVSKGDNIALYSFRNSEYIISVLAILKIGATFVPIASNQPAERIDFIVSNSGSTHILANGDLSNNLKNIKTPITDITIIKKQLETESEDNLNVNQKPNAIAYILYTSGSTGNPKGVLISNKALSNYIFWGKDYYDFSNKSSFALFTSIGFDLTITSTFLPLVSGGRIVIYKENTSGPDTAVLDVIKDNLVDTIKLTPSHLTLFKDKDLSNSAIEKIIVGGEDFKVSLAKSITTAFGNRVRIFNEYGPTEATVGCIVSEFNSQDHKESSVPIGKPISNMHAYILDDCKNLVPQGVIGALFLSGTSLADGYLGLNTLTKEKFIDNPFVENRKMYETGDLARINERGIYEYLGRVDEQVKLRGYRIELTDVESNLNNIEGVDNCAVVLAQSSKIKIAEADVINCTKCGLPSNYPNTDFDADGVCHLCNAFKGYKDKAEKYFKTEEELHSILTDNKANNKTYDCLSLLSGGKDSTYILAQLVGMGLKVLAFTLDNGYISEQAIDNVKRIVKKLDVDHVFGTSNHMNEIFVDSLNRHQNVCNGCFKTIYTLSTKIAMEKEIPFIVTGLSRGQFFETRLTEELFWDDNLDVKKIDDTILEVRKLYHQEEDAVKDLLDVSIFEDDAVFDKVQFVDFYRYSDVSLEDMLVYLDEKVGWVRPTDTGRSTNCLINQVGIYVHKKEKGYSNYSFPYSWDVRLGHKTRDESLEEINEYIDEVEVKRIMEEIGYNESDAFENDDQLVAYYTGDINIPIKEIKEQLSKKLPSYMMPSNFKFIDQMPLTKNGKIDKKTLRSFNTEQLELETTYIAPRNEIDELIEGVWKEVLRLNKIGIQDNFIALGGHSLAAIRVTSRVNDELGIEIPLNKVFNLPTIKEYSDYLEKTLTELLNE